MSEPGAGQSARANALAAYPQRLGALLRGHRRARGLRRRSLARASRGRFTATDLRDLERGRRELTPELVAAASAVYGIDVAAIESARTSVVVDLDAGVLRVGDVTAPLPNDPERALARYVQLVNRLRSSPMRSPATLRSSDTQALAEALDLDEEEVVGLLTEAIGDEAAARRKVAAVRSGTGTLAAVVVLGAGAVALRDTAPRTTDARLSTGPATVETTADEAAAGAVADDEAASVDEGTPDPADASSGEPEPIEALAAAEATPTAPSQPRAPVVPASPSADDGAVSDGGATGDADAQPTGEDFDDGEVEDETNIDAPDGPVVIERDDVENAGESQGAGESEGAGEDDPEMSTQPADPPDDLPEPGEDDTEIEDETNIDAPDGPVVIERDDVDDDEGDD